MIRGNFKLTKKQAKSVQCIYDKLEKDCNDLISKGKNPTTDGASIFGQLFMPSKENKNGTAQFYYIEPEKAKKLNDYIIELMAE